jgi:hypothetical protein
VKSPSFNVTDTLVHCKIRTYFRQFGAVPLQA